MTKKLEEIPGYQFLETDGEKERLRLLISMINEIMPEENVEFLIPNMVKDPEGKTSITGFFVFTEKNVFEFREFLTKINFDFAKWDKVLNIRFEANYFKFDALQDKHPKISLTFYHMPEMQSFHTDIVVFGKAICEYVYGIVNKLYERMNGKK